MFTGIIENRGVVVKTETTGHGELLLQISVPWQSLTLGESIAVHGACLTVAGWRIEGSHCIADFFLSSETLDKTSFSKMGIGQAVHLEKAATPTTSLSGHWVQGHVDGLGTVKDIASRGDSWDLYFEFPENLAPYFVSKGSITLNGVSLTLNTLDRNLASVRLIPHTWKETTLNQLKPGDAIHLEADILAKYVEKHLEAHLKKITHLFQNPLKNGNEYAQPTSNH